MPRLDECYEDLVRALDDTQAPASHPRPGLVPEATLFERLARVLLGMVAAPGVATAAFDAFQAAGLLDPAVLAAAHPLELDDLMKHDGVALALKSIRPLQRLATWASEQPGSLDSESLAGRSTESIRDEWRAINGIGLTRADALLLHGLGRVSYPVDRGTYRIFVRHGWLDSTADYDEAREAVERLASLSVDGVAPGGGRPAEAATAEALIRLARSFDRLSRDYCKPTQARCERCPLRSVLPPNGPVEVE